MELRSRSQATVLLAFATGDNLTNLTQGHTGWRRELYHCISSVPIPKTPKISSRHQSSYHSSYHHPNIVSHHTFFLNCASIATSCLFRVTYLECVIKWYCISCQKCHYCQYQHSYLLSPSNPLPVCYTAVQCWLSHIYSILLWQEIIRYRRDANMKYHPGHQNYTLASSSKN